MHKKYTHDTMEPIILASSSPRRQSILKSLNIPFVVMPSTCEETYPKDMKAEEVPEYLAAQKINSVLRNQLQNKEVDWILAADTIIIHKGKIYGKPKSREEAKKFLSILQGTTHKVVTGIALYNGSLHYMDSRTSINSITFAPMNENDIEFYLQTSEWHGAAGAYRIQGLGSCFIKKIQGTESSIMGLPIHELYDMLIEQNYKIAI